MSGNASGSSGLVFSSTSQTHQAAQGSQPNTVFFNPKKIRQSRLRRAVLSACNSIQSSLTDAAVKFRCAFITVTYAPGQVWSPRDISKLVDCYRKWAARRGMPLQLVWVAETGKQSGRFHYHIAIWLPRGVTPPMPDKQGWWRKGSTNCKWARRPVGYMAKYLGKGSAEDVGEIPKGARLYGVVGLRGDALMRWRWALLPSWVRRLSPEPVPVRRLPGGGYRVGCFDIRSPWLFEGFVGGQMVLRWRGWVQSFVDSSGVLQWDLAVCGFPW